MYFLNEFDHDRIVKTTKIVDLLIQLLLVFLLKYFYFLSFIALAKIIKIHSERADFNRTAASELIFALLMVKKSTAQMDFVIFKVMVECLKEQWINPSNHTII